METYNNILESYNFLNKEIEGASDRAAAIVSCAFLDDYLQQILKSYLTEDSESANKKLYGNNGPLSTFSSKITLSYRLGLISQFEYKQLNILRTIRNLFAHDVSANSFDAPNIRSILMSNIPDEDLLPPIDIPLNYKQNNSSEAPAISSPSKLELIEIPESDEMHEELANKFPPLKFRCLDRTSPRNIFVNIVFILITCLNLRHYDSALKKCTKLADFANILDIETHKIKSISKSFHNHIKKIDAIIAETSSMLEDLQDRLHQEYDEESYAKRNELEEHLREAELLKTEILESPRALYYAIAKLTYILVKVNFNNQRL